MKKILFATLYVLTFLTGFWIGFRPTLSMPEAIWLVIGVIFTFILFCIFKIGSLLYEDLFAS